MSILEQLKHFDVRLRFELKNPKQSSLAKTALQIQTTIDSVGLLSNLNPQEYIEAAIAEIKLGTATNITTKNLRIFCIAGLSSFDHLSDVVKLVRHFLEEVYKRGKSSLYRALINGYLRVADSPSPWIEEIRNFLLLTIEQLPNAWILRCKEFGLLDRAPCLKLAEMFMDKTVDFEAQLRRAGITGSLKTVGIGNQLLQILCTKLSTSNWLVEEDAIFLFDRFTHLIQQDGTVIYKGSTNQVSIVDALLRPCIDQQPEIVIQKQIEHLLLGEYKDPRVNPGKWGNVPEELTLILKRWLTKQAIGLLIQVLNRTAEDHHWDSRNAFWSYYLDHDLVEEAWVVFGPEATRHAEDLVRTNTDFHKGTFGSFEKGKGYIQPNHSVLIMRIDNVVIAEWTHNGKVRLWLNDTNTPPSFYKQYYSADRLRGLKFVPDAGYTHDHTGSWKGKVTQFIYQHTGIKHPHVTLINNARIKKRPSYFTPTPKPKPNARDRTRPFVDFGGRDDPYLNLPAMSDCKSCGQIKAAREFYISKRRPGELTVFCKVCSKANELNRKANN
ncbi:MAG: hypothetical protein OFPI_00900 [Osedax symbiont Rs2]|nr:MAG: hypothetical protein OFPI_00900 [Osedax symbiont Rs2]